MLARARGKDCYQDLITTDLFKFFDSDGRTADGLSYDWVLASDVFVYIGITRYNFESVR